MVGASVPHVQCFCANDAVGREGTSFLFSHSIGPASHKCAFDTWAPSVALLSPAVVDRTLPRCNRPPGVAAMKRGIAGMGRARRWTMSLVVVVSSGVFGAPALA